MGREWAPTITWSNPYPARAGRQGRAVLRRAGEDASAGTREDTSLRRARDSSQHAGGNGQRRARKLTAREFELLYSWVPTQAGVTRDQLMEEVWATPSPPRPALVPYTCAGLREKVEADSRNRATFDRLGRRLPFRRRMRKSLYTASAHCLLRGFLGDHATSSPDLFSVPEADLGAVACCCPRRRGGVGFWRTHNAASRARTRWGVRGQSWASADLQLLLVGMILAGAGPCSYPSTTSAILLTIAALRRAPWRSGSACAERYRCPSRRAGTTGHSATGNGDLETELPVDRHDEISQLSADFNRRPPRSGRPPLASGEMEQAPT